MSKGTRLLLWITGLGMLIMAMVLVAVVVLWEPGAATVQEGSWLKLKLAGALADGPPEDAFHLDPEQAPLTATGVARGIRQAAADPGVSGLYVELEGASLTMAGAQEIRGALHELTRSGKPCRVWSKSYDNLGWYLASACPEIHLHPEGVPFVIGLRMENTYLAGAFEKIGVQPDYEWVGEYKSAVETYLRDGPSESAERMYEELLDSSYDIFVRGAARGWAVPADGVSGGDPPAISEALPEGLEGLADAPVVTLEEREGGAREAWVSRWTQAGVEALINDPPVTAKLAAERGLVDALTWRDELMETLEELSGGELVNFRSYVADGGRAFGGAGAVAVVHLQGTIVDGRSSSGGFGGDTIGDRTVVEYLEELREDDSVSAIVLRLDSPGGSALASDVIWREVRRTDEVKPVIASMAGYAASGGYYIAMGARTIVAQPGTLTGSIGVFGGKYALGGLYEKLGVTTWSTQRGELAGVMSISRPWNDAERALIRTRMQDFYETFVSKAAESRGMSFQSLDSVARGRVWTGAQAYEVGLVDQLGGLADAVALAASEAGMGEDYALEIYPRPSTLFEALLTITEPPDAAALAGEALALELGEELASALGRARLLGEVLQSEGIAAAPLICPDIR